MDIYDAEGVDAAFWFSFAGFALPRRRGDPRLDIDMASYGAVAVSDPAGGASGRLWEPKEVFHAIAANFDRRRTT